ncbi:uncharacterized protein [Nicotiana sylvestris]|uniref:uncharacterized protein n=1 Tax=Nicotiana sylvestris TaxID=4096 RepID=UPI00388CE993
MDSKDLNTGVVDPSREFVESEYELKEEVQRLKQHMVKMYQSWIRGHPPPSFPTNYTENLTTISPLSQAQVPITVDLSPQHAPGFTPYHNYPGTSSQTFHAPPAKTTAFPSPDTQYYAPEPTFKVPDPYLYTPHFEPHVENEKPPKNVEQEEIFRKVKSLEQLLRNMQGLGSHLSVAYKDLCVFPDVQLPAGFKMPMFDLYDAHRDPVAHLRGYCSKMRGARGKDELLMAYFSQSLSWAALEWHTLQDASRWYTWDDLAQAFAWHFQYNIDIASDRLSLTKVEKKPSESFREYGFRWRKQAARVNPLMVEDEIVEYFLQALEPTYFGHLISAIGKPFNDVVKMGEMVEEGLRSSKIVSYSTLKATTQAIQNDTGSLSGQKKRDDVTMGHNVESCRDLKREIERMIQEGIIVVQDNDTQNITQNPLPTHDDAHFGDMLTEVNDIEIGEGPNNFDVQSSG